MLGAMSGDSCVPHTGAVKQLVNGNKHDVYCC
jgi:hypothetical protein